MRETTFPRVEKKGEKRLGATASVASRFPPLLSSLVRNLKHATHARRRNWEKKVKKRQKSKDMYVLIAFVTGISIGRSRALFFIMMMTS